MEGSDLLRQSVLRGHFARATPRAVVQPLSTDVAVVLTPIVPKRVEIQERPTNDASIAVLLSRLDTIERLLMALVHTNPQQPDIPVPVEPVIRRARIHDIKSVVGSHYGFSIVELDGQCRNTDVVHARHIAQHLSRKMTLNGLPEIGRRFGGRDHTSVMFGDRKIKAARAADSSFDEELKFLESKVLARPACP